MINKNDVLKALENESGEKLNKEMADIEAIVDGKLEKWDGQSIIRVNLSSEFSHKAISKIAEKYREAKWNVHVTNISTGQAAFAGESLLEVLADSLFSSQKHQKWRLLFN